MPFQIIRNDITKVKADAIVNTANPKPVIGGGTDSAIYQAAGEGLLLAERKKIGAIVPGQAVHTKAFKLEAKYIIHTVGPAWIDGKHGERDILHSCYENSLHLAAELSCGSIAFPLIATGVYGFPKDEALQIALSEINKFLLTHDMKVILVVFDRKAFSLSGRLVENIEEYIDEHTVQAVRNREYHGSSRERRLREERIRAEQEYFLNSTELSEDEDFYPGELTGVLLETGSAPDGSFPDVKGKSLDDILDHTGDTFQQRLFQLIDESGMDDVTVYKKAKSSTK